MKIEIRKAVLKDTSQIVVLTKELWDFHKDWKPSFVVVKKNGIKIFEEYCKKSIRSKYGIVFVAIVNDELVGYIFAKRDFLPPVFKNTENVYDLKGLMLKKGFRRQGLGKRLINELEKELKRRKVNLYTLNVNPRNKKAHDFYKKNNLKDFNMVMVKKL